MYECVCFSLPNTNDAISFILTVTCSHGGHDELSPSRGNKRTSNDNKPMTTVSQLL